MAEYIEREAVLMALMNDGCIAKNLDTILKLPAADVAEVKHGHWELKIRGKLRYVKCSVCNRLENNHTIAGNLFPFCPYCGAKMDAEKKKDVPDTKDGNTWKDRMLRTFLGEEQ